MVKNNALDLAVCSCLRNRLDKVCDINNCGCMDLAHFVEAFLLKICSHVLVMFTFFFKFKFSLTNLCLVHTGYLEITELSKYGKCLPFCPF